MQCQLAGCMRESTFLVELEVGGRLVVMRMSLALCDPHVDTIDEGGIFSLRYPA
jgi:hypothetical protein